MHALLLASHTCYNIWVFLLWGFTREEWIWHQHVIPFTDFILHDSPDLFGSIPGGFWAVVGNARARSGSMRPSLAFSLFLPSSCSEIPPRNHPNQGWQLRGAALIHPLLFVLSQMFQPSCNIATGRWWPPMGYNCGCWACTWDTGTHSRMWSEYLKLQIFDGNPQKACNDERLVTGSVPTLLEMCRWTEWPTVLPLTWLVDTFSFNWHLWDVTCAESRNSDGVIVAFTDEIPLSVEHTKHWYVRTWFVFISENSQLHLKMFMMLSMLQTVHGFKASWTSAVMYANTYISHGWRIQISIPHHTVRSFRGEVLPYNVVQLAELHQCNNNNARQTSDEQLSRWHDQKWTIAIMKVGTLESGVNRSLNRSVHPFSTKPFSFHVGCLLFCAFLRLHWPNGSWHISTWINGCFHRPLPTWLSHCNCKRLAHARVQQQHHQAGKVY